jgi:hypothetical protein
VPPWLGGPTRLEVLRPWAATASAVWLLVPLVLVAALAAAVRRLPRFDARRELVGLLLVMIVSALLGMAQLTGDRFGYLFEWRAPTAVLVVAVAIGVGWSMLAGSGRRVVAGGLAGLLVAGSVVLVDRVAAFPDVLYASAPLVERVVVRAADHAPRSGPLLVRAEGSEFAGAASALIAELDRRGTAVRVDPWRDFEYGRRTIRAADAPRMWLVVEEGWIASRMAALPGARLVAAAHVLPAPRAAELARLQRRLWRELHRHHHDEHIGSLDNPYFALITASDRGVDRRVAERVSDLNGQVRARAACRCAVYRYPTDRASLRRLHRFEFP